MQCKLFDLNSIFQLLSWNFCLHNNPEKLQVGWEGYKGGGVHSATMDENRFLYSFHPEEQLRRLKDDFKVMGLSACISMFYTKMNHLFMNHNSVRQCYHMNRTPNTL